MKRLLVATDLTPRSERALARALIVARSIDAEVRVLHVVDAELPAALGARQRADAEEEIGRQIAALGGEDLEPRIEVVLGHSVTSVVAAAQACRADLLVLGAQRQSPLKDIFVGGIPERLVRLAACPVLVVRDAPEGPYQRMLAAVDFSERSRAAVSFAAKLQPKTPLSMLYVYDMPYSGLASLSEQADDAADLEQRLHDLLAPEKRAFLDALGALGRRIPLTVRAGRVLTVLAEEIARQNVDLLVAGTHSRGGVARLLLGSVAGELIRRPPCDVLVVP